MQHRDMTKRCYYTIWKLFNEFFIKLDIKPSAWKDQLTLFVGHLICCRKQSSTVRSYISVIKAVLKINNIQICKDQYLLSSLTRACRLHNDQIRVHFPIHKGILDILLREVVKHFNNKCQSFLASLYCALFSTAYYGLFRVGELTTGEHPVLAKDVHIGFNKKKVLLHGKNVLPQQIKTASVKIVQKKGSVAACDSKSSFCPFNLLCQYAQLWGVSKQTKNLSLFSTVMFL